jgi:hypothetical protein
MYKLGVLFLFFYMQILFYKKLNDKLMKNKWKNNNNIIKN